MSIFFFKLLQKRAGMRINMLCSKSHPYLNDIVQFGGLSLLRFLIQSDTLYNTKLIEYNDKSIITKGIMFLLGVLLLYLFRKFDKNANSVDMDIAVMFVILNWFGDIRGLCFLCD